MSACGQPGRAARRAQAFRPADAPRTEAILLVHLPRHQPHDARIVPGPAQRAAHEGGAAVGAGRRHLRAHADLGVAAGVQGALLRDLARESRPLAAAPRARRAANMRPSSPSHRPAADGPPADRSGGPCVPRCSGPPLSPPMPRTRGRGAPVGSRSRRRRAGYDDYRGADSSHVYPVPVPYVLYNGTFLKTDRDGVRARSSIRTGSKLKLSFNATTPVSNDRTRSGMPRAQTHRGGGRLAGFSSVAERAMRASNWICGCRCARRSRSKRRRRRSAGRSRPVRAGFRRSTSDTDGWKLGCSPARCSPTAATILISIRSQPQYATAIAPGYQASGGYAGTRTSHRAVEALPQVLGGRLHALRYAWRAPHSRTARWSSAISYWTAGSALPGPSRTSSQRVEVSD